MSIVRSDIQTTVHKLNSNDKNDVQQINLWYEGRKYTVYNIYSPPNTTFDAKLQGTNYNLPCLVRFLKLHAEGAYRGLPKVLYLLQLNLLPFIYLVRRQSQNRLQASRSTLNLLN